MPAPLAFSPRLSITLRAITVDSASACCGVTPGLRRPTAIIQVALGILRRSLAAQNAMSSAHGSSRKPFGITPITERGSPSTWIVLPITSGAPPSRRCQVSYVTTIARASFCLTTSSKSSRR